MIPLIFPARWRSYDLDLEHFPTWTEKDLQSSIRTFTRETASDTNTFLLIDGLDEFVGKDYQRIDISDFLRELSSSANVKICVSSRPWELFKSDFAQYPRLRLEDLTRRDIERYVNSELTANEKFKVLRQQHDALCSQLVTEIIDKAKGVWLWVVLVVRSLLQGLRNRDTVSDLLYRLSEIPEELERIFLQMLSRIESTYRQKALQLLKVVLYCRGNSPTLTTVSFLDKENPERCFENMATKALSDYQIRQRLLLTAERVNIRCLGLLEITEGPNVDHLFRRQRVEFLHRTSRDFLDDVDNQKLLSMKSIASFDPPLFVCQAITTQFQMTNTPSKYLLDDLLWHASAIQGQHSEPFVSSLLTHCSQILKAKRHNTWSDAVHNSALSHWECDKQGAEPLLTLAIQWGFHQYAMTTIASCPSLLDRQPERPLLDFAIRRGIYFLENGQAEQVVPSAAVEFLPDLDLVRLILSHGGDPNDNCGQSHRVEVLHGVSRCLRRRLPESQQADTANMD